MGWAAVMVGIALGHANLFSKVWVFSAEQLPTALCQTDDCYRYADACRRIRHDGIAHEPWLLWFSCLLSGLGGSCLIRRVRRWW